MAPRPSRIPLPLAGLLALAVAMGIGRFAFTPVLPMMQADLGLSLAQGSWLASANYLGYLLGALLVTHLSWSPATLLRLGLWPQACATPSWTERWSCAPASGMGSASMSARRPRVGPAPRRPSRTPITPVVPP
ncbi:hypothetical protein CDEN61S_03534 [Castellaniella denitrificans]